MRVSQINVEKNEAEKLLAAASPDGALLYLYIKCGNPIESAEQDLHMSQTRLECAAAVLRQLGLYREEKTQSVVMGERPRYTENDVVSAREDMDFISLQGELERILGKTLTTEELKILLGMIRYLGMPTEVIFMLVCYCREKAKQKGRLRNER